MMKVNDFLRYEISLSISYEDYFRSFMMANTSSSQVGAGSFLHSQEVVYGTVEKGRAKGPSFWKD